MILYGLVAKIISAALSPLMMGTYLVLILNLVCGLNILVSLLCGLVVWVILKFTRFK